MSCKAGIKKGDKFFLSLEVCKTDFIPVSLGDSIQCVEEVSGKIVFIEGGWAVRIKDCIPLTPLLEALC
jgi:hypothetical protein